LREAPEKRYDKTHEKMENDTDKAEYLDDGIGEIFLNYKNFMKGSLPNGQSMIILFDSGASQTLVSSYCVKRSPYLSTIKPKDINSFSTQPLLCAQF
jgi:hypothetical protein